MVFVELNHSGHLYSGGRFVSTAGYTYSVITKQPVGYIANMSIYHELEYADGSYTLDGLTAQHWPKDYWEAAIDAGVVDYGMPEVKPFDNNEVNT